MNEKFLQYTKMLSLLSSIAMGAMMIKQGDSATGIGVITAALSSGSALSNGK